MALPATTEQESPFKKAEILIGNPDSANPKEIADAIARLGEVQEQEIGSLEATIAARGESPLTLEQALSDFAGTGPAMKAGVLIRSLRDLYMVRA